MPAEGETAAASPSPSAIALTMGDPAGIGLEITIRAWCERRDRELPTFALYADPAAVRERASLAGVAIKIVEISTPGDAVRHFASQLPVIPIPLAEPCRPGSPATRNAAAVVEAIDRAASDVFSGKAAALVTNPIAKSVLYGAGFRHPGHTEYLAHLASRLEGGPEPRAVMMLAGGGLRVVPLTIHVPLASVPRLVTTEVLTRTIEILALALERDFGIARPRIVVAGLNPHAGEGGTIGREDAEVIAPAVAALAARGLDVSGPYPADTMFHAAARARYDAAVAMYHDQALIPLKTLAFDTGVNITLGLPFVRTSPDHGTAFDIAATPGKASPESLIAALDMAYEMARSRRVRCLEGSA